MKRTALSLLLLLQVCAGFCLKGNVTINADIDFSTGIVNGVVAGTKNAMVLSNTSVSCPFELGFYNGTETVNGDVLRVGNGTGTVTIADEELAGNADEVVVTFDMYFGLQRPSKYSGFFLYDTQDALIGGLYLGWDNKSDPQPSTNTFGFEADYDHISYCGGSTNTNNAGSCIEANRTTFELHLNYATGKMYGVQKTAGEVKQTTAAIDMPTTKPLKKFVLQSDYTDSNRRSWFDNLLIKKSPAASATAATVAATIGSAGWATLYTDKALDFSAVDGLTAYTATLDGGKVVLTAVDDVPAATGVILKGAAGEYEIPIIDASNTAKGFLEGNTENDVPWDAYAANNGTLYILATINNGKDVQFVPCTSGSIAAGKAFLPVYIYGAKAMQVVFASEATGISNVNVSVPVPVKRIQNGQLVIEKNGKTYNAAGQLK